MQYGGVDHGHYIVSLSHLLHHTLTPTGPHTPFRPALMLAYGHVSTHTHTCTCTSFAWTHILWHTCPHSLRHALTHTSMHTQSQACMCIHVCSFLLSYIYRLTCISCPHMAHSHSAFIPLMPPDTLVHTHLSADCAHCHSQQSWRDSNTQTGLPWWLKNLPANVRDMDSIPDLGRSHLPWSN